MLVPVARMAQGPLSGTVVDVLDNTGFDLKQLFDGSEGGFDGWSRLSNNAFCPCPLSTTRNGHCVLLASAGVVTAVAIQCAPKPSSVQVAFLQCPSFEAVQQVLSQAKHQLGEILSAVEFLDSGSLSLATSLLPGVSNPLGNTGAAAAAGAAAGAGAGSPMYMVIETQGSSEAHDKEKLEGFLEVGSGNIAFGLSSTVT